MQVCGFACMYVLYITRACLVPTVFRRGNQMASHGNYGQVANHGVLGKQ